MRRLLLFIFLLALLRLPHLTLAAVPLSTTVPIIMPQMFGAKGDGVTDDSAAIIAAFAAVQGTGTGGAKNGGGILFFPTGDYIVSTKRAFEITNTSAGVILRGEGPENSRILYTNTSADADNYLFYAANSNVRQFQIEDMGFVGPGVTSTAGWLQYNITSGGGGSSRFHNIYVFTFGVGFKYGGGLTGTGAANDECIGCWFLNNKYTFVIDNNEQVNFTLVDCIIHQLTTTSGAEIFTITNGGQFEIVGGTISAYGTTHVIHYVNDTVITPTLLRPVSFLNTWIELVNSADLIFDERDFTKNTTAAVNFDHVSVLNNGVATRQIMTLQNGIFVNFKGGLFFGQVELISGWSDSGVIFRPPTLVVENANWSRQALVETNAYGDAHRAVIVLRNVTGSTTATGTAHTQLPDQETGPLIGLSGSTFPNQSNFQLTRREKYFWLGVRQGSSASYAPSLPINADGNVIVVIPNGQTLKRVELVSTVAMSQAGTFTIDNADGTVLGRFTVKNGDPPFKMVWEVEPGYMTVSGNTAIVRISASSGITARKGGYGKVVYE